MAAEVLSHRKPQQTTKWVPIRARRQALHLHANLTDGRPPSPGSENSLEFLWSASWIKLTYGRKSQVGKNARWILRTRQHNSLISQFLKNFTWFYNILYTYWDMIMIWSCGPMSTNVDQDLGVGEVLIADGAPLSRVQQFQPSRERSSAR